MRWWLEANSSQHFVPPTAILLSPACPPLPLCFLISEEKCLPLTTFTRSIPLLLSNPCAALSAPLSADSTVHFTACDNLPVIPNRKENKRERAHVSAHLAQVKPNLARILLCFCLCAYFLLWILWIVIDLEISLAKLPAAYTYDALAPYFSRYIFKNCCFLNS